MSDFLMPALGADMEAGTLVEWLVKPGDRVKRGDIVAVVETQKGAIEVEIFSEGIVSELIVPVGAKVPVGSLIARIGVPGEPPAAPPPALAPAPPSPALPLPPPREAPPVAGPVAAARGGAKVSPAARRRAAQLGVDAATLPGTGVDGAVTVADVEAAVAAVTAPSPRKAFDPAEMRRAIAAAMGRSKREIPHYYLIHPIDFSPALSWLERFNAAQPVSNRLLPAVLLLKAVALALREVPQLNGTYVDGVFRPGAGIHVGWAIALRGGGLIAPAILDTDRHTLPELMSQMRDLVRRARAGGLRSSQLASPTITVTSLGERGAETVMGIIYPPQVALIGFGMIVTRPWVVGAGVESRPVVTASLAADHRVSDGHSGALLLSAIERLLQEPEKL